MLKQHPSRGHKLVDVCLLLLCSASTYADTVYRCGDAYSTSTQCANTTATEVKPASVLTTGSSANTSAHDLRDAQALEKQRLQAQRQATQTLPAPINVPQAQAPVAASNASAIQNGKRPHNHRPTSPYFTAVDPNGKQKKKSTAKAVSATPASTP